MLESVPAALENRVGQASDLPSRERLSAYLSVHGIGIGARPTICGSPWRARRDNDP